MHLQQKKEVTLGAEVAPVAGTAANANISTANAHVAVAEKLDESSLVPTVEAKQGGVELVDRLALEWRFLCQESSADEPFFQPEWIAANTRVYLPPGALLLLTARIGNKLSAVLPLRIDRAALCGIPVRRLRGAYRPYSSRFDMTRRDGPLGDRAVQALWAFLKGLPDWDVLDFHDVPQGGALEGLSRLAEADGFSTGRVPTMNSPYLPLSGWDGSHDYFLRQTNPSFASKVRRRKRKLAEQGSLLLSSSGDADPELLQRFFDLEASGWKGRQGTAIRDNLRRRQFYEEVAHGAARFGHFRIYFLEHHGKTVAGHIGFTYRRRHSTPKGAHNEEYNRYGPGHLLIDALLCECAKEGLAEFDFLCEDDPWKLNWTSQMRPHAHLYIFRKNLRGRLAHQARFKFKPVLRALAERKPAKWARFPPLGGSRDS